MIVFDFISEKLQANYFDSCKTPERGNYQLIGGEIIEMASTPPYHQEKKTIEIYENTNGKFYLFSNLTKLETAKLKLLLGFEIELEKVF